MALYELSFYLKAMKYLLLTFYSLLTFSCSQFYEFSNHTEEKEMYRAFKMPVGKDTLDFNAYNDYYFDTIDLKKVYITSKELKNLKKSTVSSARNKQILFLHNDTSHYLNIIGYHYPDLRLNEIKNPKFEFEPIPLTTGKGYKYLLNGKQINEFFIPYSEGILRFFAIGNPEWSEYHPEKFEKEIDFVFYVINSNYFRLKPKEK